ncbi:MAG: sodium/proline symporter PutP [Anaerovoracaceae bacterium]
MTTSQICIMISITAYLILVLGVGIYYAKKNENVGDFYLGGRKLGPIVTAMSAEASDMSGWLLMGLPGVAYLAGMADATWTAIGLAIGTYVNWLIVAKRIRTYSHNINAITIPDFFSKRYHDKRNILNCIAAIIIIVFFIPYTASGFAACGKLFSSIFGIDYFWAMVISALVIVGYTTLGGFLAASTTDLMQSVIMTVALIVVLGFGINVSGGFDAVIENAKSMPGYFTMNASYDVTGGTASDYGLLSKISTLAWGLGYFGMPHVLLRFMAIEDKQKLKTSRRIATTWVIISLGIAIFIGIVGNAMTKVGAIANLEGSASETIIVEISSLISTHGVLAALLAGVILAGILAATMSTSDSQLLAASSSVSQNLFGDFFGINMSDKKSMFIARATVLCVSALAVVFASNPDSSVFEIVSFAWAGFGATFGPVVLAALFWKRSNKQGAIAGMLVGAIVIFVWKYVIRPMGGVWNIYELLPAFVLACITIVVVSLLTKAPEKEITDEFDAYKCER